MFTTVKASIVLFDVANSDASIIGNDIDKILFIMLTILSFCFIVDVITSFQISFFIFM